MENRLDVHVLPCLIKEPGYAPVKREFTDKIFHIGSSTTQDDNPLADFTLRDICGTIANDVDFQVDRIEHFDEDLYSSPRGTDPLLGRNRLCNFLRGRCLRGSRLDLDSLGCRLSRVDVSNSVRRESQILQHPSIQCQRITETESVASLILWNQDRDISPLDPVVAGYKHILIASAVSDHKGEQEFVMGLS